VKYPDVARSSEDDLPVNLLHTQKVAPRAERVNNNYRNGAGIALTPR